MLYDTRRLRWWLFMIRIPERVEIALRLGPNTDAYFPDAG